MLLFILGGGGVLLTDGLGIYHYYLDQNNGSPLFFCTDLYHLTTVNGLIPSDISGADNYVPIEFAGVVVSMLFYVSYVCAS